MQIEIKEVVSHIRAVDGQSALAPETLCTIVSAVMQALEQREREMANENEEQSLKNYQQRNQPWNR